MKLFTMIVFMMMFAFGTGFRLIPDYNPPVFLNLEYCPNIDPRLTTVIDYMKSESIPFVNFNELGRKTSICNAGFEEIHNNIGITYPHNKTTIVYIANEILSIPHTLYNVVLHEFLHVLGLGHSEKRGITNHSITVYQGKFLDDLAYIYPSMDDVMGLMFQKGEK